MFNDVIELLEVREFTGYGAELQREISGRRKVYANVKTVGYREFYQAAANGLKPTLVFTIALYWEYQGEKMIEYNGELYDVIRMYRTKDGENAEITVSAAVNMPEVI